MWHAGIPELVPYELTQNWEEADYAIAACWADGCCWTCSTPGHVWEKRRSVAEQNISSPPDLFIGVVVPENYRGKTSILLFPNTHVTTVRPDRPDENNAVTPRVMPLLGLTHYALVADGQALLDIPDVYMTYLQNVFIPCPWDFRRYETTWVLCGWVDGRPSRQSGHWQLARPPTPGERVLAERHPAAGVAPKIVEC